MFISELFEGKGQVPSNPKQKQGPAGQARGTDKAPFRNKLVGETKKKATEAMEREPQYADADFSKPMFEFNHAATFHPGMLAYHNLIGKVKIVGENGDELVVVDRTGKRIKVERSSLQTKEEAQVDEGDNPQDEITMDVPLLIRLLEYAREDAKTDMDLHNVAEQLIKLSGQGCLSMKQYNQIVGRVKEMAPGRGHYAGRGNVPGMTT